MVAIISAPVDLFIAFTFEFLDSGSIESPHVDGRRCPSHLGSSFSAPTPTLVSTHLSSAHVGPNPRSSRTRQRRIASSRPQVLRVVAPLQGACARVPNHEPPLLNNRVMPACVGER